jgi:hypothetical protein
MMSILDQLGAFTFDVFLVNVRGFVRQMGVACAARDIVGAMRASRNSRIRLTTGCDPNRL